MTPTARPLSNPKGHIFLIEDDVNLAASLVESLEYLGYSLYSFSCAEDLFNSNIFSLSPSVIISDISLPGISGIDLQAKLKELGLFTPIIFISGACSVSETIIGMKQGAIEFLTKPFRREDLNNAVDRGIELERMRLNQISIREGAAKLLAELAPREREVFDLLVQGDSNLQIALTLKLSGDTVKQYKKQIKQKLQMDSLSQFISLAKKTI